MAETEIKTLEMVRRIRDEHYEKTKNMTEEELLQFYRREAEAMNSEALGDLARAACRNLPIKRRGHLPRR